MNDSDRYAAAALMGLALSIDHHKTGVLPPKPSTEAIERAAEIVQVLLEVIPS